MASAPAPDRARSSASNPDHRDRAAPGSDLGPPAWRLIVAESGLPTSAPGYEAPKSGADRDITGLPEGYETLLGPTFIDGMDLSTGQWQRVALARTFFRDAPLVILDEPRRRWM